MSWDCRQSHCLPWPWPNMSKHRHPGKLFDRSCPSVSSPKMGRIACKEGRACTPLQSPGARSQGVFSSLLQFMFMITNAYCTFQINIFQVNPVRIQKSKICNKLKMEQQNKSISILAKHQYRKNLEKWKKSYGQRLRILSEVLNSQAEYVKTLGFITRDCKQIIVGELRVDAYDFDEVFGCVESIAMLHLEFHKELKARFETKEEPGFKFGDILVRYVPFFKVYSTYMRTLGSHKTILVDLKGQGKLSRFKECLQKRNQQLVEKFGEKLIKYMNNIDVVDYISTPFQRIYNYEMFLTRYMKLLKKSHPDFAAISESMVLLRQTLNKFNEDVGEGQLNRCLELEKKYGCKVMPQRKFQGEFSANYWAGGSKMPTCRVYILSDVFVFVDEATGKLVKMLNMNEQSWYHLLNVGKNINNAIFIKGVGDSYQGVFVPSYTLQDFLKISKKLFSDLPNRLSLKNKNPTLIIKPISVSRLQRQCIYTLFLKIHGCPGGVYNSFTIPELQSIHVHLAAKHPKNPVFKSLEDVSEMTLNSLADEDTMSDFDAQLLALSLFHYFAPLMCDFELVKSDQDLQTLLGIRDYVAASIGQLSEDTSLPALSKEILRLEERTRVEEIKHEDKVELSIQTESGEIRKTQIGKEERAYSIIRKIINQDFNMDFALFITSKRSKMRILDDDDVVYEVMKREGYTFKEETNFFMQGLKKLDSLLGWRETVIYLKKYVYLQAAYPEMLQSASQERLQYLTDNVLSILLETQTAMSVSKTIELLALVIKLKEGNMIASTQSQLISNFWRKKVKGNAQQSETSFGDQILGQYSKLTKLSYVECFSKLLAAVEFSPAYSFVVDCKIESMKMQLIVKHRELEVRENISSQTPLLRVELLELDYMWTPSYIKVKVDGDKEVPIELEWVYGVRIAIERNRHILRIKARGQA